MFCCGSLVTLLQSAITVQKNLTFSNPCVCLEGRINVNSSGDEGWNEKLKINTGNSLWKGIVSKVIKAIPNVCLRFAQLTTVRVYFLP